MISQSSLLYHFLFLFRPFAPALLKRQFRSMDFFLFLLEGSVIMRRWLCYCTLSSCLYGQTAEERQSKKTILSFSRKTAFCSTIAPAPYPRGRYKIAHIADSPDDMCLGWSLSRSLLAVLFVGQNYFMCLCSTAQARKNTDCSCLVALPSSFTKAY